MITPPLPTDRKFGKISRLRGRSNYLNVLRGDKSRRLRGGHCRITAADSISGETEFGISISRKTGIAVRRNRLKRVIREFLRNNKSIWPSGKMIVIGISSPVEDEATLIIEIEKLLGKLG